jgi:isopenicillin N synthase-like dioxygenase
MTESFIKPISIAHGEADPDRFAQELGTSFAETGFAVISDHGIPQATIDRVFNATRDFFALPEETKRRYFVKGGRGQRGYTPFGIEAAKGAARADLKEFWHTGRDLPSGHPLSSSMPPNLPVHEIPQFDSATRELFGAFDTLGMRILRAVARYLGLAPDYFEDKVKLGNSILRLLHYPPLQPGAEGLRAGAHEDINVITLLLGAEEAGLELKDRSGQWRAVDPPPGGVVVNIGDMLQRLTNHVLPSTSHRVVNPTTERASKPRYSMPFFQHFASDFPIATLPSCITPDNPNRYPVPITADDYLQERLAEIKLS